MEWTCTVRQGVQEQVSCISAQGLWVPYGPRFINRHNKPPIKNFFPESAIEELNTGHWSKSIHLALPQLLTLYVVHAEM